MTDERHTVLRTQRLLVRTATEDDVELYYALWTDPRVMRFVGFPRGLPISRGEILDRLRRPSASEMGRRLVAELLASAEPIGECNMSEPNQEGIVEPDVKLLPAFWGHRYGVELWQALVDHTFLHTGAVAVHGTPNVQNIASIKMQAAAGAVCTGEGLHEFPEVMREYTTPVHYAVYRLTRESWASARSGRLAGTP